MRQVAPTSNIRLKCALISRRFLRQRLQRALLFSLVLEGPNVFEPAERPVDIFHPQFEIGLVECDPARKGLANELVTDGHVGDEGLATVRLRSSAKDPKRLAQRNKFRIALDVGDEIEHLNGVVANAALVAEQGQGLADLRRSALGQSSGLRRRRGRSGRRRRGR